MIYGFYYKSKMKEKSSNKTVDSLRCTNDLNLFEKLSLEKDIIDTNEWIRREVKKNPMSTRRHLLSNSVRLTQKMSPQIHSMANECIECLGVKLPLELFVYASSQFNAACFKPEQERLYVMFSSSLLEGFSADELKYVMGHELGHHIYRHHEIPIGYLLKGKHPPSPKTTLELFAWSRYAEISADRAGAFCAQNFDAVASALFKLSSGLTSELIKFELHDFLDQVDDMQAVDAEPGEGAPIGDWFSTHPFSPLRVKALDLFHRSELMNETEMGKEELEIKVLELLGLMEPSYLAGKTKTAESMRRVLFAGAITIASASGGISSKEVEVFESFFGKNAFGDTLNIDKIKSSLVGRAAKVLELASHSQRFQLLRDLALIAKADNRVSKLERQVLNEIALSIGLTLEDVELVLSQEYELD